MRRKNAARAGWLLAALLPTVTLVYARHKGPEEPPFQYLAGTEDIAKGCAGRLQVLNEGLTFTCPAGSFQIPFPTITLMQFRPDISKDVLNMKIVWKISPQLPRMRQNKYFTVVADDRGKVRAVILLVNEEVMRPYFAELELRSGKGVQEYRDYGEFQ